MAEIVGWFIWQLRTFHSELVGIQPTHQKFVASIQ